MSLKNIFEMVKADRWTQDGCEALNKAHEADVEDKTYNIGEISQKTGLQKTANGWVKPRSGKAPGVKTGPGVSPKGTGKAKSGAPNKADIIAKMTPEQRKAVESGRTLRTVNKNGLVDITKEDLKESASGAKPAEWETKGKYEIKKFDDENSLNNFLKENGFKEQGENSTSFSEKGAIHESIYKNGNETLVKLTGPGITKPTIRRKSGSNPDPKLAKEIANMNHFEESKKAAQKAKREEALKADRREGEANAEAYRKATNEKALNEWTESAKKDAKAYNENMVVMQHPGGQTTAVREGSPDVEKAEAKGYKKMSLVRPDGSVKTHEGNAESKPAKRKTEIDYSKMDGIKLSDKIKEQTQKLKELEEKGRTEKNGFRRQVIAQEYEREKSKLAAMNKALDEPGANDAAPRVLTGDCKVKIKK